MRISLAIARPVYSPGEYDTKNHTEKFNHSEISLKLHRKALQKIIAPKFPLLSHCKYVTYCIQECIALIVPLKIFSVTHILCSLNFTLVFSVICSVIFSKWLPTIISWPFLYWYDTICKTRGGDGQISEYSLFPDAVLV